MPAQQEAPLAVRVGPMDAAHRLDWDILDLGYPQVSQSTVHMIDMDLHIFGLEEIAGGTRPVGVILLSHGWANKARDMWPMASGLIGGMNRLDREGAGGERRVRTRDVLVVTLDQRNHGDRRRIRKKLNDNDANAFGINMAMALTGGIQDHELIMEFLEGHLFPKGERTIAEFMTTGFSMGGHIAWRLVRQDPRIRIAVPICSIPSETLHRRIMKREAAASGAGLPIPAAVERFFFDSPPVYPTYADKYVLALHGGLDNVMSYAIGDDKWHEIAGVAVAADRYIQPDTGHIVSEEMVRRTAEWMWRYGFTEAVEPVGSSSSR